MTVFLMIFGAVIAARFVFLIQKFQLKQFKQYKSTAFLIGLFK